MDIDALGDAYEYLIGQFAAGSGEKAGEFYTPQQISDILSAIVTLDTYQFRKEEHRYISTAAGEAEIDLEATHGVLAEIERGIQTATEKHNGFLKELGLPLLPGNRTDA
jgi:type I restriction-modification system DNA methylase subunit